MSATDAPAIKCNGFKAPLANGESKFFINATWNFINSSSSLPRSPPYCVVLHICVFKNLILANDLENLGGLKTCLSVNINLCGKPVLWFASPFIFSDIFRVVFLAFFVADFHL